MLRELSGIGTSTDAHGPVTPDLIDAILASNAGVPLLELGTRDSGHIAPINPAEIVRCRLPKDHGRPPVRPERTGSGYPAEKLFDIHQRRSAAAGLRGEPEPRAADRNPAEAPLAARQQTDNADTPLKHGPPGGRQPTD